MSAVDVLAVMAWAVVDAERRTARSKSVTGRAACIAESRERQEARAAVAELMEAARIACALPTLGNIGRLGDALARCKGEGA